MILLLINEVWKGTDIRSNKISFPTNSNSELKFYMSKTQRKSPVMKFEKFSGPDSDWQSSQQTS